MSQSWLTRFIGNRSLVFMRVRQWTIAMVSMGAAVALAGMTQYRPLVYWVSAAIVLGCAFVLVTGEVGRIGRAHRFRILPPGRGSLGHRQASDNHRLAALSELFAWRWSHWPGSIRYGKVLNEHRIFGFPRRLVVAGPKGDPRHAVTIAGARSGKGRAMLVPNLLEYQGSALVIDPKGQLAAITANARGKGSSRVTQFLGQDIHLIDPENIVKDHPVKSSFNPMSDVVESNPLALRFAKIIAESLVPQTSGGDASAEYFQTQARMLLTATILHVATFEPEDLRHLVHVRHLLTVGDLDGLAVLESSAAQAGVPCPAADGVEALLIFMSENEAFRGEIQGVARSLLGKGWDERGGVLGAVANALSFIGTPGIRELLDGSAGPQLELRALRARPTTVYVCLSNTALQREDRGLMLMLLELATVTLEREPRRKGDWPVLIAMDEFYSLGYLKTIDIGIGAFAGYGILLWPVVQSVTQLQQHYPKTWQNLLANCRAQQYFGQLDPETHEYLSQRVAGIYSKVDLSSSFFSTDDRRQIVTFADRPASLLQLTYYDEEYGTNRYDIDPYL
ncbi:type IV secretion system protein VirD4 [Variovorax sp. PBL-H6]|uniref:type IV secretory system conjugative DNA transfer family protein n=1 Tax=Variovorax sp. PBL-H6 TaxID=434009 RepID=UPI001317E767|nr:type IV secretory system conjugative DNA transfer family protein [Variovorax sp. PBL-H6]VTU29826.1 type IV secretion system protein VirD4 [Variovorax sp. PBL-H6]